MTVHDTNFSNGAYCLQATLRQVARQQATEITARTILEKFKTVQRVDVDRPTTDGRGIHLSRQTEPNRELALLMHRLDLNLPKQPSPSKPSSMLR